MIVDMAISPPHARHFTITSTPIICNGASAKKVVQVSLDQGYHFEFYYYLKKNILRLIQKGNFKKYVKGDAA